MFFGGTTINGKVNKHNLNNARDSQLKAEHIRIEQYNEALSEAIGCKPEEIKYKMGLFFDAKKVTPELADSDMLLSFFGNHTLSRYIKTAGKGEVDNITYVLDKSEKLYDGMSPVQKMLTKAFAIEEADLMNHKQRLDECEEGSEEYDMLKSRYEKAVGYYKDTYNNNPVTMSEMMGIYMYMRQAKGINHLLRPRYENHLKNNDDYNTNDYSPSQLLYVYDSFLNNPEFEKYRIVADNMQKIMSDRFANLAEVFYLTDNKLLQVEDWYFPIFKASSVYDTRTELTDKYDEDRRVSKRPTNERSKSIYKLNLDVVNLFPFSIKQQENFIANYALIQSYQDMLREGSTLNNALTLAFGRNSQNIIDTMRNWLNIIASNGALNKTDG